MTCTRETDITDWQHYQDAIQAWERCGCTVCDSALQEVPTEIKQNPTQTTL